MTGHYNSYYVCMYVCMYVCGSFACMMAHEHSKPGIEGQGHRSRSKVKSGRCDQLERGQFCHITSIVLNKSLADVFFVPATIKKFYKNSD